MQFLQELGKFGIGTRKTLLILLLLLVVEGDQLIEHGQILLYFHGLLGPLEQTKELAGLVHILDCPVELVVLFAQPLLAVYALADPYLLQFLLLLF